MLQISTFFDRVDGKSYSGKWKIFNGSSLFENKIKEGDMNLKFEKITEFNRFINQATSFGLKILQGNYIDSWIQFRGYSFSFMNITFNNNSLKASYSSYLEYGELFEKKGELSYCQVIFSLTWNNTKESERKNSKQQDLINPINSDEYHLKSINGTFQSDCGININFELYYVDEKIIYNKISYYAIALSCFSLIQLFNTFFLTKKINEANAFSNGVIIIKKIKY